MNAIERAKRLLCGRATFALVNGKRERVYYESGIQPLLNLSDKDRELLKGAAVADKIVGKAAACLMAAGGAAEVYAGVMSRGAMKVFDKCGIKYTFDTETEIISNRTGTGACPMEQTVRYIDDPAKAEEAIRRTQHILKLRAQGGKEMKKLGFGMMRLPL